MTSSPLSIYHKLYRSFGPQGWWPVSGRYEPGRKKPLSEREKQEVCLGAVLTQNAAWKNAEKALENLRREKALDFKSLAALPQARLQSLVRPSGYFVQKAKKLKSFALHVLENRRNLSSWFLGPLEGLRRELLDLYGVGPETADSILLYAAERPVFVVDAYTVRIGKRIGLFQTEDYHRVQDYFMERLPRSAKLYQEFHALLVALAKSFCTKRDPLCFHCPVLEECAYGRRRMK